MGMIDGHAAQECYRNRKPRKLRSEFGRQILRQNCERRKRIKRSDLLAVLGHDKDRSKPSIGILSRLALQVSIQSRDTARKSFAVMDSRQRLNSQIGKGAHWVDKAFLYRAAAAFRRAFGPGGWRSAFTKAMLSASLNFHSSSS